MFFLTRSGGLAAPIFWARTTCRCSPSAHGVNCDANAKDILHTTSQQLRVVFTSAEVDQRTLIRERDRQRPAIKTGYRRIRLNGHPHRTANIAEPVHDLRPSAAEHLNGSGATRMCPTVMGLRRLLLRMLSTLWLLGRFRSLRLLRALLCLLRATLLGTTLFLTRLFRCRLLLRALTTLTFHRLT